MASNIFTIFSGNKWTSGTSFSIVFIKVFLGELLISVYPLLVRMEMEKVHIALCLSYKSVVIFE